MNPPAEILQLSQEEQGRLLARVYAFILSDQFTGTQKEIEVVSKGHKNTKNCKYQIQVTSQEKDTQLVQSQELLP